MTACQFFIVDAFTQSRDTGNPAGVVLHSTSLSHEQMRQMAGELGLETAFLTPCVDGTANYTVAYYTALRRVPLCGHDTVAAATMLAHMGRVPKPGCLCLATDVGLLTITIGMDGLVWMTQALPRWGPIVAPEIAAQALGLKPDQIWGTSQVVSTGTPFLFVPLREVSILDALHPDPARLTPFCDELEAAGVYVWTEWDTPLLQARCFAPGVGLPEDPVTGSASGALGAYRWHSGRAQPDVSGVVEFTVEQGRAMGRPGHAQVRVEVIQKEVRRVQVGGYAVLIAEGTLWLP